MYGIVKINTKRWLEGDIRKLLNASERGILIDLIAVANESSERGVICTDSGVPYTLDYLAGYLSVDKDLLDLTIAKCISSKQEIITVNNRGCFVIKGWVKYE